MAELEIDQSNLPRVQEVCQCFAVLEDGVLAHNLQEQEIEQYYTTNIQKNQLVQNDIRVAKRLQDEEEEQRAQQSALLRQASRQLEEQDFEYALVIQQELQRCAEEAQRREQADEEIARRMQEEEEQRIRKRSRGQESEGSTADPAPPHQHTLSYLCPGEGQCSAATTRWRYSTAYYNSDITCSRVVSPKRPAAHKNTTSWSNQPNSTRYIRSELREPVSEDSEDSDSVFSVRQNEKLSTAPPQRRASLHHLQQRNYRSLCSRSSFTDELRDCEEERGDWDEDCYDSGDLETRRPRDWERNHAKGYEDWSRDQERDSRFVEMRTRRSSRSESVRLDDRSRRNSRHLARTWSYKDNPDKRVHFQDDARPSNRQQDESSQVWEMLGQVLMERGVPVRFGSSGAPLKILPQSRDSQVLHGSEVSCSDTQPHQRVFQRAANTRHSFHGDVRERKRLSYRENSGRDHREERERRHNGNVENGGEITSRDAYVANRERRRSRRWREHRYADGGERERRATHSSEHRRWHHTTEERWSSEEEGEGRMQHSRRSAPLHSQSFSSRAAAAGGRPRPVAAGNAENRSQLRSAEGSVRGVSLQQDPSDTRLNLAELQQVLQDEELARKLQEEDEMLLSTNSQPSPRSPHPDRDFRVAQVAQDEEIARFMQKQEIKSKRGSRELEGPTSWREHRAMISHHDRRAARERAVQRERLDSEGLPSPTEDCTPENQPSSPVFPSSPPQPIRNIAEELDPTFQARRQSTESLRVGQTGPTCQPLPTPPTGLHDFLEEPTFIPPTKRQTDKSGSTKPKEKKEHCKQQ